MFGFLKKKKSTKQRGYSTRGAHYNSATSQLLANLRISGSNIDDIIESQYMSLVSRARSAYANNDYVKGFISQACINVIGNNGIKIQVKTAKEELNKLVEAKFKKWCKRGNCEVTGIQSFIDIQLMTVKSLLRDGEFFIIKNIIKNQLKLQVIEPTRIDVTYKATLSNNIKVINGIEVDQYGKAIAFYYVTDDNQRKRIPAENIIHGFIQEYVSQKRGISAAATALIRLGLLGEFETAAIDHARQSAKILGFVSKPASDFEPMGTSFDEEEEKATSVDIGEGARLSIVEDGLTMQKIDSQFPSSEYGNFKDAILRAISLSLGYGVNFINMGNNLEKVNYSSARQGLLAERDSWKLLQRLIIDTLIEPVFTAWFEVEYLSGRLGVMTELQYEDILDKVRFQPRSWAWIDPLKDAKGITENINNLTMSLSDAIIEAGRDPDDVFEQIARDNQKLADLNIQKGEANVDNSTTITEFN
ncbi:phage portal protein [Francisella hispaniensis]|uniref:Phage-related portal protein n=1 Tax=Francisella hispaniensis TaxID=622488 RepID=F4BFR2_9GAMM|nr:phage portal protein [Francisella hispaniensis]AEE26306.1 phage-related portal protein [Francisella hispaniensis]